MSTENRFYNHIDCSDPAFQCWCSMQCILLQLGAIMNAYFPFLEATLKMHQHLDMVGPKLLNLRSLVMTHFFFFKMKLLYNPLILIQHSVKMSKPILCLALTSWAQFTLCIVNNMMNCSFAQYAN